MLDVIIVSYRGPYAFNEEPDGTLSARRGAGGVVSALGPLLHGGIDGLDEATTWIATAIGAGDRRAARDGIAHLPGVDLVLLDLPEAERRLHYDVVSNEVLWFLHHGIFDLVHAPAFDQHFDDAWAAFRSVNAAFADAVCERAAEGELVFVQDYQLALVPAYIQDRRPDLRVLHFTHIPFCGPNSIRILPEPIAVEYLSALARVRTGFHSDRWRRAYLASIREVLGDVEVASPFVAHLGPDCDALAATLAAPEAPAAAEWFSSATANRMTIVRTDRVEPTKNLVRGFAAYAHFLDAHPEWHERVTFVACCYRSRQSIPLYQTYGTEVDAAVNEINARFRTSTWTPIVFDVRDDHTRSVVALAEADVIVVNPLKDGLNLVAMEAAAINRRDGVVICSKDAGVFDVLHDGVIGVNPYDLDDTAEAMATALTMAADARHKLASTAQRLATTSSPTSWLAECLAVAPS